MFLENGWYQMVSSALTLAHLLGLAFAVGASTVKLALVIRAKSDLQFLPAFLAVRKPITRLIVLGMILVTVSGIVWFLQGYPWSPPVIVKMVLVGLIWALGPIIDNAFEPKLERLAPGPGEAPTQAFRSAQRAHLVIETLATALMYGALVLGSAL